MKNTCRFGALWGGLFLGMVFFATSVEAESPELPEKPNMVVIFCDDLGYGDLGCFGHPTIQTPNLDRMAEEGQKWTNFYAAASVCTPSRAGLVTGRLPIRSGMCSSKRRVLFPNSGGGLPRTELTIAEVAKTAEYRTMCVGKWHLGHLPEFLPTNHGFDHYFGIPYSNDMDRLHDVGPKGRAAFWDYNTNYWNVPLMQDEKVIERPADQTTITRRYTEEAVRFITEDPESPFFLYLAHSMPHVPLFTSEAFRHRSLRGRYGDVIEEIDWSVGRVLDTLRELELQERTLVVFSSDNGPWLIFNEQGGSAGLLREGKGCTFEGGMREPTVFWWPGVVSPGVIMDQGSTLDFLPTFASLSGVELPEDLVLDGYDLTPTLTEKKRSPRDRMYYYRGEELYAVRKGAFKAHFITQPAYGGGARKEHDPPLLFHLHEDPSEQYNVADDHPEMVRQLKEMAEAFENSFTPPPSQLEIPLEK